MMQVLLTSLMNFRLIYEILIESDNSYSDRNLSVHLFERHISLFLEQAMEIVLDVSTAEEACVIGKMMMMSG